MYATVIVVLGVICCCRSRLHWYLVGVCGDASHLLMPGAPCGGRLLRSRSGEEPPITEKLTANGYTVMKPYRSELGTNCSWNIPAPARIAVFPLPNTSHAKPTRGAKFFFDGVYSGPTVAVLSEKLIRSAEWPFISCSGDVNS